MSRYEVTKTTKNGNRINFVYGYDGPTFQYFLDVKMGDDCSSIVGFDGPEPGTNGKLLQAMQSFGIIHLIPGDHYNAIVMDMPIPDRAREPEPHGSRDTFVPRSALRRSNRVPFVPASEGPDGERFNAMQD